MGDCWLNLGVAKARLKGPSLPGEGGVMCLAWVRCLARASGRVCGLVRWDADEAPTSTRRLVTGIDGNQDMLSSVAGCVELVS